MTSAKPTFSWPTVLAIGITVYLIKNVVHEGLGHGLVCILVGGKPIAISSAWWDGNYENVSEWGRRWTAAAGTFANLSLGVVLLPLWRAGIGGVHLRLFLWLLIVGNLFSGAGYLMADPIGNFGDWSQFLKGLEHQVPLRIALFSVGLWATKQTLSWGLNAIESFLGLSAPERSSRAKWLCLGPYLLGGTSFTLAGLLNPMGARFAFTSALATFGGTAFLAWMPTRLNGPRASTAAEAVHIERSVPWLLAGAASMLILFALLGPSIHFGAT